eukprot:3914973-Rhodomonas_salina.1
MVTCVCQTMQLSPAPLYCVCLGANKHICPPCLCLARPAGYLWPRASLLRSLSLSLPGLLLASASRPHNIEWCRRTSGSVPNGGDDAVVHGVIRAWCSATHPA